MKSEKYNTREAEIKQNIQRGNFNLNWNAKKRPLALQDSIRLI